MTVAQLIWHLEKLPQKSTVEVCQVSLVGKEIWAAPKIPQEENGVVKLQPSERLRLLDILYF